MQPSTFSFETRARSGQEVVEHAQKAQETRKLLTQRPEILGKIWEIVQALLKFKLKMISSNDNIFVGRGKQGLEISSYNNNSNEKFYEDRNYKNT